MSDEAAAHFGEQAPPPMPGAPEGKSITLSITLHPNGQIDFSLPMGNKVLAYGLIEVARAQLDKLYLVNEMKQAKASRGGLEGLMRRVNGG